MRTTLILLLMLTVGSFAKAEEAGEWIQLFNGKDLTGWATTENPESFRVEDGKIVGNGDRAHLFYVGDVANADFKNFEWRCKVMLKENSNSGMYFHTAVQDKGWPNKGYEAQLNNSHGDIKKTGGLYDVDDVLSYPPANDNEWFTQTVTVKGKHIVVKVNGKITTDYTEPEDAASDPNRRPGRTLSSGTFALQGHDPGSTVMFEKIEVRLLD